MGFISNAAFPGVKAGERRTPNRLELLLLKQALFFVGFLKYSEIFSALKCLEESV